MSKLYYRLNSLCVFLKQEKLIDDYDISHLKYEIDERKLSYDYNTLRLKFENDNKIFEKYKDFFIKDMSWMEVYLKLNLLTRDFTLISMS